MRDEWYVPAVRGHQIQFNAAVARAVRDLAAQVSGLEAATLAQSVVDTRRPDPRNRRPARRSGRVAGRT